MLTTSSPALLQQWSRLESQSHVEPIVSTSLFLCCCLPDIARWVIEPSSDYCGNKTIGPGMGYPLPS
ncbi:hypothetical protein IGI04_033269 [Brassica rapa subsp. trilocularis]|uniref:Uncharacterized protein n=1 Tax=Brassica rapa subsp. trilocularis TaxID=1813537 RepID=A0ABQ7L5D2_BRACM|nr:hypothetical protein IGI04_033269 [Brassica rapa subsp. trilocularis]